MSGDERPTCFIAMPITTHEDEAERYGDDTHWAHVMDALFVKAIDAAGYRAIRPETTGAYLIHERIVTHLSEADLVLCDLSSQNPNVLFELGVRTSLNLPIALVHDGALERLPFDTSGINTPTYKPELNGWEMDDEVEKLARHIKESAVSCAGSNPLWRQFGLKITAQQPTANESPMEAKIDLLLGRLEQQQADQDALLGSIRALRGPHMNRPGDDPSYDMPPRSTESRVHFRRLLDVTRRTLQVAGAPYTAIQLLDHPSKVYVVPLTDDTRMAKSLRSEVKDVILANGGDPYFVPPRNAIDRPYTREEDAALALAQAIFDVRTTSES